MLLILECVAFLRDFLPTSKGIIFQLLSLILLERVLTKHDFHWERHFYTNDICGTGVGHVPRAFTQSVGEDYHVRGRR